MEEMEAVAGAVEADEMEAVKKGVLMLVVVVVSLQWCRWFWPLLQIAIETQYNNYIYESSPGWRRRFVRSLGVRDR